MSKKTLIAIALVFIAVLAGLFYLSSERKKARLQAATPVAVEAPTPPAVAPTAPVPPPVVAPPATRGGDELAYMYGQRLHEITMENEPAFREGIQKAISDFVKSHVAKDPELSKRRAELDADREKVITRRLVEAGKDPKSDTYVPGRCDQLKPLICSEGRFEKKPPYAPDVKK